jgi:hypothetical protein
VKIRIWKPGEKGNPSDRYYYYQFFLRQKRYRGILDARNAEQAKQAAQKIWDDEWNRKYDPEPSAITSASAGLRISFKKRIYLGRRSTKVVMTMMSA